MAKKNFGAKLKQAQKLWDKSEAASGSSFTNENVEDGRYKAKLTAHELDEMGGNVVSIWSFEIVDNDDCEGEVVKARYNLTKEGMGYLKRDLKKFEVELEDLEEFEEAMEGLVEQEPVARIMVRTKDDWQNIFINKVEELDGKDDDEDEDDKKPSKKDKDKKSEKKDKEDDDEKDDEKDAGGEIEVGSTVKHKKYGTCEVVKVNKDGSLNLKDEDDDEYKKVPADKCELVEDDEDEDDKKDKDDDEKKDDDGTELKKGMKVVVQYKGKDENAKIVSLDEDEEEVTVKLLDKNNKEVTVSLGDVEVP